LPSPKGRNPSIRVYMSSVKSVNLLLVSRVFLPDRVPNDSPFRPVLNPFRPVSLELWSPRCDWPSFLACLLARLAALLGMEVVTSRVFSAEIPFRLALVIADLAAAIAPLEEGQGRESRVFPAEADWCFLDGPDILPKLVQLSGAAFRLEDGRGPSIPDI
jgi:hypothetical protein